MRINPNENFEARVTWPSNNAPNTVKVHLYGLSITGKSEKIDYDKPATISSIENFNKAFKASNTKYKNAVLYLVKEKIHSNLKCRS